MKLYYSKGACSLAVRIAINEMGLKSEFEAVNLQTKKTEHGEDFLKINPKGAVPTLLTDENEILTENATILQYLAEKNNAEQLLPTINDFKRFRVLEWLNYVATEMHKGAGVLFNPNISQEVKDSIFIPLAKKKLDFLNTHLSKNKFLCGDSFTLPDGYLFVILNWLPMFKINIAEWPHLANYFNRIKERAAVAKSLKEEGLI
jgi:glutathione S-transferase